MDKQVIGYDIETVRFSRGLAAPPFVCLSLARRVDGQIRTRLLAGEHAVNCFRDMVKDPSIHLVAHNNAFDATGLAQAGGLPVLREVFRRFRARGFECTQLNEQLLDIAKGMFGFEEDDEEGRTRKGYDLASLMPELDFKKGEESWQTNFGSLLGKEVHLYPEDAKEYAIKDSIGAVLLREKQLGGVNGYIADALNQAAWAFPMQLMRVWGVRTDGERLTWLRRTLEERLATLARELRSNGLLRDTGARNMAAIQARVLTAAGGRAPLTASGKVSTKGEVLAVLEETDPILRAYKDYVDVQKLLSKDVVALEPGIDAPICANWWTLANTGRTRCSRPNLQNLPRGRKGSLEHHIRESVIPRPGYLFSACDFDSLEVRTLAHVLRALVDDHTFAKRYADNPDFDPHTWFGAMVGGITHEEGLRRKMVKDREFLDGMRQPAKPIVFGVPGGMGHKKLRIYARTSYGVDMDEMRAKYLRNAYLKALPGLKRYLDYVGNMTRTGLGIMEQLVSGRIRGGVGYSDMANGYFQGLAADGVKAALFDLSEECYVVESSPCFGSRPVLHVHDELIMETPEDVAPEAAVRQEKIMCSAMERYTPGIPHRASPALMRRWYKKAEAVYDVKGRLKVYEQ